MFWKLVEYFKSRREQSVILHTSTSYYFNFKGSNKGMDNLGEYLICDVGGHIDFWIEFLNDPKWPETQSNWCVLEKDGDEIRMFDFLTEERFQPYPVPEDEILRIKNSELQKLLYQWDEILSRDPLPSKIKITEKRGVFKMEAVD